MAGGPTFLRTVTCHYLPVPPEGSAVLQPVSGVQGMFVLKLHDFLIV